MEINDESMYYVTLKLQKPLSGFHVFPTSHTRMYHIEVRSLESSLRISR